MSFMSLCVRRFVISIGRRNASLEKPKLIKTGILRSCRLKMGWKTIDGRRYYYKSEREGGRVKTTYFGAGESGLLMSSFESVERAEREAERDERRAEREENRTEEKAVVDWFDVVQAATDAAMLAAGFHKHKGQWRRKRK